MNIGCVLMLSFFLMCTQAVCCLTWFVVVFGADTLVGTAGGVETVCHCRKGSEFLGFKELFLCFQKLVSGELHTFLGFILGLKWLITDLIRVDGNGQESSETMNGKA